MVFGTIHSLILQQLFIPNLCIQNLKLFRLGRKLYSGQASNAVKMTIKGANQRQHKVEL